MLSSLSQVPTDVLPLTHCLIERAEWAGGLRLPCLYWFYLFAYIIPEFAVVFGLSFCFLASVPPSTSRLLFDHEILSRTSIFAAVCSAFALHDCPLLDTPLCAWVSTASASPEI